MTTFGWSFGVCVASVKRIFFGLSCWLFPGLAVALTGAGAVLCSVGDQAAVFHQHAAVHYHVEAGSPRRLRRIFVYDAVLHPHGARPRLDCVLDDGPDLERPSEYVDNIDGSGMSETVS